MRLGQDTWRNPTRPAVGPIVSASIAITAAYQATPTQVQCCSRVDVRGHFGPRGSRRGWFADRLAFVTPDGHDIPCRLTGVWRREGDEWKLIQSHASIGVPNAQAFGP